MRRPQWTLQQMLWWTLISGVTLLLFQVLPRTSFIAGPLWLSTTGHVENARIGAALGIAIWPGIMSFAVWPTKRTLVVSIGSLIAWILSGVFFRHIADW